MQISQDTSFFVTGHKGLVGSAIYKLLKDNGFKNIFVQSKEDLDLTKFDLVHDFFKKNKPDIVINAAAKVGGIFANSTNPVEFLLNNTIIQNNILTASYQFHVKRLIFLGSSCIYPSNIKRAILENDFLSSKLEETNQAYAIAKIHGIQACKSFNIQYGTKYIALMPPNIYGPNDNYDPNTSHVLPAIIKKVYDVIKKGGDTIELWGSGKPRREFLHSYDLADAVIFIALMKDDILCNFIKQTDYPLINVGSNEDLTIQELAEMVIQCYGKKLQIRFDKTKPDGVFRKLLDSSRINNLGWKSKISLESGIKMTIDNFHNEVT